MGGIQKLGIISWQQQFVFTIIFIAITIICVSSSHQIRKDEIDDEIDNNFRRLLGSKPKIHQERNHSSAPRPSPGINDERIDLPTCGGLGAKSQLPVKLELHRDYVTMNNGIVEITLSKPGGFITGIQYNGISNLLEIKNNIENRGYWDLDSGGYDRIKATSFRVIKEDANQVELSFVRTWDARPQSKLVPLNIDKRFILLRGCSGFYSYAIYERLEGWPGFNLGETRIAFKLRQDKFQFMAMSDNRQRIMPTPEDRLRGQRLAYPEAVLLTNPTNPILKGEVDDKYQYSCENKDNRVHGWISSNPKVGFWIITPSDEFRTGGPLKQDLTSHVGPTSLAMFVSTHYSGEDLELKFQNGEAWKKVFGPVFIYLNSVPDTVVNPYTPLWEDAKRQMMVEVQSWPYSFPVSEDFPKSNQRGVVNGRLVVHDRYSNGEYVWGSFAYVGLAPIGIAGSWQKESKGYQFWTRADINGSFSIGNIREGNYSFFAWVPGFIGDYKYELNITIIPGSDINLGILIFEPPRTGPTIWEIGFPDRSASEFYVPDPDPRLTNRLYVSRIDSEGRSLNYVDKFRQYGLWERYTDLYPKGDLIYTIGASDFTKDWFFGHFLRRKGKTYVPTTWQIKFKLENVNHTGIYKLQIALASATYSELQVRINNGSTLKPHFRTGLVGRDNAIARHGIHGLYWLFSKDIPSFLLLKGENTIYLTQSRTYVPVVPVAGIMYDYIRLEGPSIL